MYWKKGKGHMRQLRIEGSTGEWGRINGVRKIRNKESTGGD